MSTGNTTEAEIIAQASFDIHASCFTYSILALFSYDFLITLSQEIKFVWGHKFTGATVIYLLNRYIIVLYLVLNYVPLSCSQSFVIVGRMVDTLECAAYFVVAVFSALRVYAIRDQSMLWASAVLVLALVPFATNIYNFSRDHAYHSALGCEMISTISVRLKNKLEITTRVCAIAVDFLLLFATLLTTFGIRFPTNMHSRMSLMTMVLRDGSIYFAALFTLNILQIAMYISGLFIYTSIYLEVLSSMLISRFVLDLRQVHLYNGGLSTSSFAPPDADMRSASGIIGNMGAPLRAGGTGSFSDMHSLTWADDDVEEVPRVAREPFKADLEFADVGENIDSDTVINPDLHVADGCEEIEMAEVNGEAGAASSV